MGASQSLDNCQMPGKNFNLRNITYLILACVPGTLATLDYSQVVPAHHHDAQ